MKKYIKNYKLLFRILFSLMLLISTNIALAQASLSLSLQAPEVNEKDTFVVTLNADSVLTGEQIYAYRFELDYDEGRFEYLGIDSVGSILSAWGDPYVNSKNTGRIVCASAGTSPLEGQGALIHFTFIVHSRYGATFSLIEEQSYFNEGVPATNFNSIYINPIDRSYPNIYDDSKILFIGDEVEMHVSGGVGPYVFAVEDTSVAVISEDTKVKGKTVGLTKVYVTDSQGEVNYTTGNYDIRGIKLWYDEVTAWPNDTFLIPLQIEVAPGVEISSGYIEIDHQSELYSICDEIVLADFSVSLEGKSFDGKTKISFATTQPITGSGVLCYIPFTSQYSSNYYRLNFTTAVYNETLLSINSNPYIRVQSLPTLSFSPDGGELMWGQTATVTVGNGMPPYQLSTSGASVATIDPQGNLYGVTGGQIKIKAIDDHGASAESKMFTVYDHQVSIHNTEGVLDVETRIPIISGLLPGSEKLYSYEAIISIDTTYLEFVRYEPGNNSFSITSVVKADGIHLAAASGVGVAEGTIGYLVCKLKPNLNLFSTTNVNIESFSGNEGMLYSLVKPGHVTRVDQITYRPVANAGSNFSINEGETAQLDGSNSYDDDGDQLTYKWIVPAGIHLSDSSAVNPTFTAPQVFSNTNYVFTLIVNDGENDSDPSIVVVNVLQVNKPPVANAGSDRIYNEGNSARLDGSGSYDLDGNQLAYQWNSLDGIILDNLTLQRPAFIAPQVETDTEYRFTLQVSDGIAFSEIDTVVITIANLNKKPVAFAGGDQSVDEGSLVTLDGSSSADPDNEPITYLWTAPDGIQLSSVTAIKPTFIAPAVYLDSAIFFTLVVNDGVRNSDPDQVKIIIRNVDILSDSANIVAVNLDDLVEYTIDSIHFEVSLKLPYGYDVRQLNPFFEISEGAMILPGNGLTRDYTEPKFFNIIAEDRSTEITWKVSVYEPEAFSFIDLQAGWNWLSLNVIPFDYSVDHMIGGLTHTELDYLKSVNYSSVYYNNDGWFGDLSYLPHGTMFQYKKLLAENWEAFGLEINPSVSPVPLATGWNNIPYYLKENVAINDAFVTSTLPSEELILKSKDATSIYYPGSGWVGDIDSMMVLQGYKLKCASPTNFYYNPTTLIAKSAKSNLLTRDQLYEKYGLNAHEYENSATFIAIVKDENAVSQLSSGDLLFACDQSGNIRGVTQSRFISELNEYIFILTFFSNLNDEEILFKVKNSNSDELVDIDYTIRFTIDDIIGAPLTPVTLILNDFKTSVQGAVTNLKVYPNPATNNVVIASNKFMNAVEVYSASGVRMSRSSAFSFATEISLENYPAGIYHIKVETDSGVFFRKITKAVR